MDEYRRRGGTIEAIQWFKLGDHERVQGMTGDWEPTPGKCDFCMRAYIDHGFIETLTGGQLVCPGDWVLTDDRGDHPCRAAIFEELYEKVAK